MKKRKKIVLCHGVFDVVHSGHINYLKKAKQLGDILVVSVTSDNYVNKGPGRPVFNINQRINFLTELKLVDRVYESNDYTAEKIIEKIRPDISNLVITTNSKNSQTRKYISNLVIITFSNNNPGLYSQFT